MIPGLGRSPGEGKGYPLQFSGLENSIDCTVPGVAKSRTRPSDFHYHFFHDSVLDLIIGPGHHLCSKQVKLLSRVRLCARL